VDDIDISELTEAFGFPTLAKWTRVVGRRGKAVWRIDCPDRSFAVRVFRPGEGDSARHEQAMMSVAREAGLPVAAVRGTSTSAGRPVLLLDWSPGRSFHDELYAKPWAAGRLGEIFGQQQAALHSASASAAEAPNWIDFFGTVEPALRLRLEQARRGCGLIHLDYHPANVLLHRGAVSGIIDWTNSRFGDPRADLAWSWVILTRAFRSGWRRPIRHLAAGTFIRGWRRGYVRLAGRPTDMPIFFAWAMHGLLRIQANPDRSPRDRANAVAFAEALQKAREKAGLSNMSVPELVEEAGTR
jgi:Ser/Thr protein kinase RdoA (MazF antagonist)